MSLGPIKEYKNSRKIVNQAVDVILNPSLIPLLKKENESMGQFVVIFGEYFC